MKAIFVAIGVACAASSPASAQLAPLEVSGPPASVEGLAAVGTPTAAEPRGDFMSPRNCHEQARGFRARNTQSPSRRQQALEECVAAAATRERVDVAGD